MRALHVLVVDDDADFRKALRGVVEYQGCTVSEAADGKLALHTLLNLRPDLILFDLQLPVMNGWAFYARLQDNAALAAIPTAVLSSGAHMRPVGLREELKKPVVLDHLLRLLRGIGALNDLS